MGPFGNLGNTAFFLGVPEVTGSAHPRCRPKFHFLNSLGWLPPAPPSLALPSHRQTIPSHQPAAGSFQAKSARRRPGVGSKTPVARPVHWGSAHSGAPLKPGQRLAGLGPRPCLCISCGWLGGKRSGNHRRLKLAQLGRQTVLLASTCRPSPSREPAARCPWTAKSTPHAATCNSGRYCARLQL